MTDQRDLKRRVRERMTKTGESYTAARKHILDQREPPPRQLLPPMEVVEPIDLTEAAQRLGFKCRVKIFPTLAAAIETTEAMTRLRDALLATEDDPATWQFRASVFRGELPPKYRWGAAQLEDMRRFVERARAGIGGVSPSGTMLALQLPTDTVLCVISTSRTPLLHDEPLPLLWLHSVNESVGTLKIAGLLLR